MGDEPEMDCDDVDVVRPDDIETTADLEFDADDEEVDDEPDERPKMRLDRPNDLRMLFFDCI